MFVAKKLEVDASHNLIVMLMEEDAKELGFQSGERIKITNSKKKKSVICELEIINYKKKKGSYKDINLKCGEVGLFENAFEKLESWENQIVNIILAKKPKSLEHVRNKFNGHKLHDDHFLEIMTDIVENRFSEIETTFFVLACSVHKLDFKETVGITNAMIKVGKTLNFKTKKNDIIVDKHCIGGIPGNRTTMVVVPIIAAAGLKIPKTSSRSITSPAGTADTMEVLTNVSLTLSQMHKLVTEKKGCIVWGGAFDLSPADDIIIHVEHPLRLDFEVQMIASILSKKKAAGSTHVLIDIPYGERAKVKNYAHAKDLKKKFEKTGKAIGLEITAIITEGFEPIGNGIGPLYEALDVLKVLNNEENAPADLREKSLMMAGKIIEMSGLTKKGEGYILAQEILRSGHAADKFDEIIEGQGRKKIIEKGKYTIEIKAKNSGKIVKIDNRLISKLAFSLGAPQDKSAGLYLHKKLGNRIEKGETILTLYSNSKLKLKYALLYLEENEIIKIK
ncbi:MAG: thymidine phosphorylase family protein [Nanoarchaeota archaeon]|nr:thymidine phosphorylase family protein [Nanoarchaeota archaeon]